jgi:hypothetical protein
MTLFGNAGVRFSAVSGGIAALGSEHWEIERAARMGIQYLDGTGAYLGAPAWVPNDHFAFWLNSADGVAKLCVRFKNHAGTVTDRYITTTA